MMSRDVVQNLLVTRVWLAFRPHQRKNVKQVESLSKPRRQRERHITKD